MTKCINCGSDKFNRQERGFKLTRAVVTGVLFTPIVGGVVGLIGRKKLVDKCMDCGKEYKVT